MDIRVLGLFWRRYGQKAWVWDCMNRLLNNIRVPFSSGECGMVFDWAVSTVSK